MQPEDNFSMASLFEARKKIYPAKVKGFFRRIKWITLSLFLGIYYLTPWIRWDRGSNAPDQAVLIDTINRKFYFFFIELWPQEVYYFTGLLLLAGMGLFFITSLAGRVWCGYACPQTVWTDLFLAIERWVEGDKHRRIRLDKSKLTFKKLRKKLLKHTLWIFVSLCTGGAWVFYFVDAPTLWLQILTLDIPFTPAFWLLFLTASTYIMAGFAREQVCTYMCPYARFQGAMFDNDTLIVSYDKQRGEPRGKNNQGDCIDCKRCVSVCPTGIDIREGQQYQCITCALCIDACNNIMDKINKPRGLIRYTSENALYTQVTPKSYGFWGTLKRLHLMRPRSMVYFLLIAAISLGMLYGLIFGRSMIDMSVIHARNPLFVQVKNGNIRNIYTIRFVNKTYKHGQFILSLKNAPSAQLKSPKQATLSNNTLNLLVPPSTTKTFRIFVEAPKSAYKKGKNSVTFHVKNGKYTDTYNSLFITPKR